ncbi:hypothetical protein [Shewanella marisflavi]|uniref:hypothetical protein n=1 Tax=Shewanella marisflavi TaxID=260364 RepID=UPI003AAB5EE8
MNQSTEGLLSTALLSLSAFLATSSLDDEDVMQTDCLEEFENYEWQPNPQLGEADQQRWTELHQNGCKRMMSVPELKEFFKLTSPEAHYHIYYYYILSSQVIDVANKHLTNKAQRVALTPQSIQQNSKAEAASFVFDLRNGDINTEVAKVLSAEQIFDAVLSSSSLTINVDEQEYTLEPYHYWNNGSQSDVLAILDEFYTVLEVNLLAQHQALTQGPMVDWRFAGNALHLEPVRESYKNDYTVEVQFGNQIALEIKQSDGEPALGMLIEINHGTPAVHIDIDGDDLLHIHKGQGGLVLTPDESRFEQAAMDELSYNNPNSLLIKP